MSSPAEPRLLPIHDSADRVVAAFGVSSRPVRCVIEAPTGSGKSTQIPQILLDAGVEGGGEIAILQPRRIAARMLARRVAFERGGSVGDEVGYQVRFEKAAGPRTRIRFVTEGILFRELLGDARLSRITTLIFDEFHERHLYGDITLARALDLQDSIRPDLRVAVMSATLQTGALQEFLDPCDVVGSAGRTYPVEIEFAPPRTEIDRTLPEQAVRACRDVITDPSAGSGDVLVFMPGAHEIRRTVDLLRSKSWMRGIEPLPLFGDLPPAQQDRAVTPGPGRKIVVSTNVAETSLTIDGITAVIDSGLARIPSFDPVRGINTLTVQKISRASADQRAGRAGRTAPGRAIRLWSERDHAARLEQELPEVRRLDLSEALLMLKASGVRDAGAFRWLDPPDPRSLDQAEGLLRVLGAADRDGAITPTGRAMMRFPMHPRYARMLLAAADLDCFSDAALCIAIAEGRSIFARTGARGRESFAARDDRSDFLPQIRAWQHASAQKFRVPECSDLGIHAGAAREAGARFQQILRLAGDARTGCDGAPGRAARGEAEPLGKSILAGFADHLALRFTEGSSGCYLTGGRKGKLADDTIVRAGRLLVAAEVAEVEGRELRVLLRNVTAVDEAWLAELFPDDFSVERETVFDPSARRVVAREIRRFRDLDLEVRERGEPDSAAAARLLAERVAAGDLVLKQWDHGVEQWIARVNSLAQWMPELEFPSIGADERAFLLEQICAGAKSYREIKDRAPWNVLRSWLSEPQREALDAYAPERVALKSGRQPKVAYADGADPVISVILQDLYDEVSAPKIAGGRISVVVEVLAPNRRPVQITRDLESFWNESYPEIRRQLKGRYPKHEWR